MDIESAHRIASSASRVDPGSFYGAADKLAPGVGLIFDRVEFPLFDAEAKRFAVKSGLVYVISHECDLDPANDRMLNELAVVCPITKLEDFITAAEGLDDGVITGFIDALAARNVSRAVYLPPMASVLPYGGFLYLNSISHTHISKLTADDVSPVGCVTSRGLMVIDYALEQHLRRPKADRLPLASDAPHLAN